MTDDHGPRDGLIYKALAAIQADVAPVAKTEKNPQQGYAFRGIAGVAGMLHPLLAKHGVLALPTVIEQARHDVPTRSGGALHVAILTIEWRFVAADGSSVTVVTVGEGADSGDKATNKAMTASQKYALTLTFSVPFDDQQDGDADSPAERALGPQQAQTRGDRRGEAALGPAREAPPSGPREKLGEGDGISAPKAKRAIAISINTGEREGCHGFEVIGSVLKGAGLPAWGGQGSSQVVVEHLCAVIPWRGKSYDAFIEAIERWTAPAAGDAGNQAGSDGDSWPGDEDQTPPPPGEDDIAF